MFDDILENRCLSTAPAPLPGTLDSADGGKQFSPRRIPALNSARLASAAMYAAQPHADGLAATGFPDDLEWTDGALPSGGPAMSDWQFAATHPDCGGNAAQLSSRLQQQQQQPPNGGETWPPGVGLVATAAGLPEDFAWADGFANAQAAALRSQVKSEGAPEFLPAPGGHTWLDGSGNPMRPMSQSASHYTWLDASRNASLGISSASTWSDDMRRPDARTPYGDSRHGMDWRVSGVESEPGFPSVAGWAAAAFDSVAEPSSADVRDFLGARSVARRAQERFDGSAAGPPERLPFSSQAPPAQGAPAAHGFSSLPFTFTAGPPTSVFSDAQAAALQAPLSTGFMPQLSPPFVSSPMASEAPGAFWPSAQSPSAAAQYGHGGAAALKQTHQRSASATAGDGAYWGTAAPEAAPDLQFDDFVSVFLHEKPGQMSDLDQSPVAQASAASWGDLLTSEQMDDPFASIGRPSALRTEAAAAIASAPHLRSAPSYDRAPNGQHAGTHHLSAAARGASFGARHADPSALRRPPPVTTGAGYGAAPQQMALHRTYTAPDFDAARLHNSARLYDEHEAKSVVVGGAAVMLTGQLQQPTLGSDGYIRKDSLLGDIIRVRRPASGGSESRSQRGGRGATLQEKVAAVCPQDSGGRSNSLADCSTHGGSTSRKRKAAAELKALALDGSHHSTGRGTARRKAPIGLSTAEHIKSVMGATEPPALVEAILAWEAQQPRSGKWKGVNARQWGKVGIEIRLTGQSRHEGPVTAVGEQVARFADIVLTAAEVGTDRAAPAGRNSRASVDLDKPSSSTSPGSSLSTGSLHPGGGCELNGLAQLARRGVEGADAAAGNVGAPQQPKLIWRNRGKDKAWLGTYHTPVNAAVHHDFFKVVLAVEGKIFTSRDMDACDRDAGRQRPHLLKMNFPMDELPKLMRQSVAFTNLWHKYYQGSERYIFRDHDPAAVEKMVQDFIDQHCGQLRDYIPAQPVLESDGGPAQPRTQPRRASKAVARDTLRSFQSMDSPPGDGEAADGTEADAFNPSDRAAANGDSLFLSAISYD